MSTIREKKNENIIIKITEKSQFSCEPTKNQHQHQQLKRRGKEISIRGKTLNTQFRIIAGTMCFNKLKRIPENLFF